MKVCLHQKLIKEWFRHWDAALKKNKTKTPTRLEPEGSADSSEWAVGSLVCRCPWLKAPMNHVRTNDEFVNGSSDHQQALPVHLSKSEYLVWKIRLHFNNPGMSLRMMNLTWTGSKGMEGHGGPWARAWLWDWALDILSLGNAISIFRAVRKIFGGDSREEELTGGPCMNLERGCL